MKGPCIYYESFGIGLHPNYYGFGLAPIASKAVIIHAITQKDRYFHGIATNEASMKMRLKSVSLKRHLRVELIDDIFSLE